MEVIINEFGIYDKKDVAGLLGLSVKSIGRITTQGDLKSHRVGRQNKYLGSDILRFIKSKPLN